MIELLLLLLLVAMSYKLVMSAYEVAIKTCPHSVQELSVLFFS